MKKLEGGTRGTGGDSFAWCMANDGECSAIADGKPSADIDGNIPQRNIVSRRNHERSIQ